MATQIKVPEFEERWLDTINLDSVKIEVLCQMGDYNQCNPNIRDCNFPAVIDGRRSEPSLIRFNRRMWSHEVVKCLEEKHYRLATARELLRLGIMLRDRPCNKFIVALSDSAVLGRKHWVVCLGLQPMWRECGLRKLTTLWTAKTQFLVFKI